MAESPPQQVIPPQFLEVSPFSLGCVYVYSIAFLISVPKNLQVLLSLRHAFSKTKSRITLTLLHLTLADLIVCCTVIPTEIFWRLTVQWNGGMFLCKAVQFLRAFGLYSSSLVLICVSLDRYLAIYLPIRSVQNKADDTAKVLLILSWISAFVFAVPQALFYTVESHPVFTNFHQCVTNNYLYSVENVQIYTVFSVSIIYFVPLVIIIFTYIAILAKLVKKKNCASSSAVVDEERRESSASRNVAKSPKPKKRNKPNLLSSSNQRMSKAVTKTLIMTVVIVVTFVLCWTPYVTMTLWYVIDMETARDVDYRIQESAFLMAAANSCLNPFIHMYFSRRKVSREQRSTLTRL